MVKKSQIFTSIILFYIGFIPKQGDSAGYGYDLHRDFAVGYDFSQVLVLNFFMGKQFGLWGGVKIPLTKPEGEKKFFSKNYADKYMDNEFIGYSSELFYGAGGGFLISFFKQHTVAYIGVGGIQSLKYRQYLIEYYKDHSFEWSKYYYIEDGKISEISLDIMAGIYFRYQKILFGIGYSTGTSNWVLHAGTSFD